MIKTWEDASESLDEHRVANRHVEAFVAALDRQHAHDVVIIVIRAAPPS